jgi:hypothetical protein
MKTYEQQLEEIQQAISILLSGAEEASYNGQRVRKTNLDMLQKREVWLTQQITNKRRGGIRVRNAVPV